MYDGIRRGGVYEDRDGKLYLTYTVHQVLAQYEEDIRELVTHAVKYVTGVPTCADVLSNDQIRNTQAMLLMR